MTASPANPKPLGSKRFRTPRAAALAGIVFSLLLIAAIAMLRFAMPDQPDRPEAWLAVDPRQVFLALNMIPFAGIAFLWFIGVLRDRLGAREDRFFATVFLGSGILFLAMLFAGGAVMGSMMIAHAADPTALTGSPAFTIARALTSNIVNIYAIKMASVFMIVTSTLVLRTGFAARWIAFVGYALSLPLLFGSRLIDWGFFVFPGWVLLMSAYILFDNMRERGPDAAPQEGDDR